MSQNIDIRFKTRSDDTIPESLTPSDLNTAIERGRVKYVFHGAKIPDKTVLK